MLAFTGFTPAGWVFVILISSFAALLAIGCLIAFVSLWVYFFTEMKKETVLSLGQRLFTFLWAFPVLLLVSALLLSFGSFVVIQTIRAIIG